MHILQKTWTGAAAIAVLSGALCFSQPAYAQVYDSTSAASTIRAGVNIPIRTSDLIDASAADGRIYTAVVDQDVYDSNGRVAIPRGSTAELMVKRNNGELSIDLESLTINGERYAIDTSATNAVGTTGSLGDTIKSGAGSIGANKDTAEYIGGGALVGTIVGAIAGGGKGAAVGAAVGAAAGAGAQIYTHGKNVSVPAESLLTYRLDRDLTLGVQDDGYTQNGSHHHRF
jgi:hypothetical protein